MIRRIIIACLIAALCVGHADATQLTTMGVSKAAGGALDAFDLSYVVTAKDTSTQTTYTFTSVSVGADVTGANKRYTVVGFGAANNPGRTINSATICGVAATLVDQTNSRGNAAIGIADTSGLGTTCTIASTYSNTNAAGAVAVWRLINPSSATATAHTCAIAVTATVTLSINISSGGAAVGYVAENNTTTDATFTWAGLTESVDETVDAGTMTHSGATGGASGSPTVITVLSSQVPGTSSQIGGCSASWAP